MSKLENRAATQSVSQKAQIQYDDRWDSIPFLIQIINRSHKILLMGMQGSKHHAFPE